MPLNTEQKNLIKAWFDTKNLDLNSETLLKLSKYYDLILKWSGRINLISKGDRSKIVENHILDSLGPIELIPRGGRLVDIGSGAGFPGIPISLAIPSLQVCLIESVHKKVLFLQAVKSELSLGNIEIVETRLEDYMPPELFDVATIRALPHWESYLEKIKSLLKPGGRIIYFERRSVYTSIVA